MDIDSPSDSTMETESLGYPIPSSTSTSNQDQETQQDPENGNSDSDSVANDEEDFCWFDFLPDEIINNICSLLSYKDLLSFSETSHHHNMLANDFVHWRNLVKRDFVDQWHVPLPKGVTLDDHDHNWQNFYEYRYHVKKNWDSGSPTDKVTKSIFTTGPLFNVQFMDNDRAIVSGQNETVSILNLETMDTELNIDMASQGALGLRYDKLKDRIYHGDFQGAIRVCDMVPDNKNKDHLSSLRVKELKALLEENNIPYGGCIEKSDLVNKCASSLPQVKHQKTLWGHEHVVVSMQLDHKQPDSNILASASFDSTIRIWDTTEFKESAVLNGHQGPVDDIKMHGSSMVSSGHDCTARFWDIEKKECIYAWQLHTNWIWNIQWDYHQTAITGGCDGLVYSFDLRQDNGQNAIVVGSANAEISGLSVDFVNNRCGVTAFDGRFRLYDLRKPNDALFTLQAALNRCCRLDMTSDAAIMGCFNGSAIIYKFN